MPDNPKITAILPCFNHAQFLEERIQSVLGQTHPVDQIVFLDDASTDDSTDIARNLLKGFPGQVDFCLNCVNSGSPFAQWNAGIRLAKSDLIWIAETDDSCQPQLLEKLYSAMSKSNAVLAFAQSRYIDQQGASLGSAIEWCDYVWPRSFRHDFSMPGNLFITKYLSALNAIPNASAVLFKKSAFLAAGGANSSMRYAGDWYTWISLAEQGVISFVSSELNFFRAHSQTTRSIGYTSSVASEVFACRLRAYLVSQCNAYSASVGEYAINQFITPLVLFRSAFSNKLNLLQPSLESLNFITFIQSKRSYNLLANVPKLSFLAWKMLHAHRFISFCLMRFNAILTRFFA